MSVLESLRDAFTTGTERTERAEDAAASVSIQRDEAFEVVVNSRRRWVVAVLAHADCVLSKRELSRHVAACETQTHPEQLDRDDRRRVYISLHQCHLPTLDQLGVVEFDDPDVHPLPVTEVLAVAKQSFVNDLE